MFFVAINLLPYRAAAIKRRRLLFNVKLVLAALSGAVAYLVLYSGSGLGFGQQQQRLAQLKQELTVYAAAKDRVAAVQQQLALLKSREEYLIARDNKRAVPLAVLVNLAKLDFSRVYLTNLSYEDGHLLLIGVGIDETAVNKFLQQLAISKLLVSPQDVKVYDAVVKSADNYQVAVKKFQLKTSLQL